MPMVGYIAYVICVALLDTFTFFFFSFFGKAEYTYRGATFYFLSLTQRLSSCQAAALVRFLHFIVNMFLNIPCDSLSK